jgi:uncharacterized repeat protein (TIGR01451 family)
MAAMDKLALVSQRSALGNSTTKAILTAAMLAACCVLALVLGGGNQATAVTRPSPDRASLHPAGTVISYTTTIVINTYPYASFLSSWHNDTYNVDYPWLNWGAYNASQPSPSPQSYELLVVENDYLTLTFLPELGGRLYQVIFKPTSHNELYQNSVIKPNHWGPPEQGWWLAVGGMEWSLPVEEHGYQWGVPWSYETASAADGITVTLRDSADPDRLRATVSVHLPADGAYFVVRPLIQNARGSALDYKYWTNAMLAPGPANTPSPELRFIFPVDEVTVHSTGDPALPGESQPMNWPEYDGRDMSRLGNWRQWLGFFERPAAQGDFTAVYDLSVDEGMVRVFPSDQARGAKGFAFGWDEALPTDIWTDDGSYYVEMHGGVAPTFWDSASLAAGASHEWEETWYPAAGIGGVTAANREAALHLNKTGDTVTVGVHSTAARSNSAVVVWRQGDAAPSHHQIVLSLGPAQPYTASFSAIGNEDDFALIYLDDQDRLLVATETSPEQTLPVSQLSALPPYTTTTGIALSWDGGDDSAVLNYDLQVRDGYDDNWTDWLTRTTQTTSTYTGQDRHTYFFRIRARDIFGNIESWRDDEWGDAFTSILVTPAPVLITSVKKPSDVTYLPGTVVTYTLSPRNTGNLTATARLTDTLPTVMTLLTDTLTATRGIPLVSDGLITWQSNVAAEEHVTITYVMLPTAGVQLLTPITNIVSFDGGIHSPFLRQATVQYAHLTQLPLIVKSR